MTWAVRTSWRFEAVEVVKETAKMVFYLAKWNNRETRQAKDSFLPWRGSEEDARIIADKLTSALAERDRRRAAANEWFDRRKADILASADTHPKEQGNG